MITPILEKLLLNGFAKNKILHFGWGSFTQLKIPADSFIVIHKIHWHPAINQKFADISTMTWKQFFRFCEMQLKIESAKESPMYYFLRNEVNWQAIFVDPTVFNLNTPIDQAYYDSYILMTPKKPVIFDTFITAFDYLNFTLTRDALLNTIPAVYAPVNNLAEVKPPPSGVRGLDVLLKATFTGVGTNTAYQTPNFVTSGQALTGTDTDSYHMDIDTGVPLGDNGSLMNNPDSATGVKLANSEFVNNPLLSIEYCIVQKNWGAKLSGL